MSSKQEAVLTRRAGVSFLSSCWTRQKSRRLGHKVRWTLRTASHAGEIIRFHAKRRAWEIPQERRLISLGIVVSWLSESQKIHGGLEQSKSSILVTVSLSEQLQKVRRKRKSFIAAPVYSSRRNCHSSLGRMNFCNPAWSRHC